MSDRALLAFVLTLSLLAAMAAIAAPEAHACGGCVVPAPPPGGQSLPVVQDSERVFFHRDPATGRSRVWVEVRYSGLAEEFGWILPVPAQPKVSVGSSYLFDRLDQAAAPRFVTRWLSAAENCRQPVQRSTGVTCGADDAAVSGPATSVSDAGGTPNQPVVQVLEQDQTGPYDYVVLQGNDASALQGWLDERGYVMPKSAGPALAAHIAKGDLFVAIKLSNGAGVDEIAPVVLEMQDADPCVPLRLTAIAAIDDMSVVVYLAGPGRAVPKNHMHVKVNPFRLSWGVAGGVQNYPQVMAAAMDEAAGRAFVTEYAQPVSKVLVQQVLKGPTDSGTVSTTAYFGRPIVVGSSAYGTGELVDVQRLKTGLISEVKTYGELAAALKDSDLAISVDAAQILARYATPTSAAEGETVLDVFTAWQDSGAAKNGWDDVPVDGIALAAELEERYAAPLRSVAKAIAGAKVVTRLAMRISPEEMDRDPVFAFNPDLPFVDNVEEVTLNYACRTGLLPVDSVRMRRGGLDSSWIVRSTEPPNFFATPTFNTALDPRWENAPAAMRIELLDETGPPTPVAQSDVKLVDTAIAGALPGKPALPAELSLKPDAKAWQPPPADPLLHLVSAAEDAGGEPGGCGNGAPLKGPLTVLLLAGLSVLLLVSRRRLGG